MAATTISTTDPEKDISIILPDPMLVTDEHIRDMISAMANLHAACPISSIILIDGVSYLITFKDARTFRVNVSGTEAVPQHSYVSADAWSVAEFLLMRAFGQCMTICILEYAMSAMEVAYA